MFFNIEKNELPVKIIGYKALNSDFTNRSGFKFEIGKTYKVYNEVKFGNNGNGFHFCENFEDTLRYFDAIDDDIILTKVEATGKIVEYNDEYYGFYNMYCSEKIKILEIIDRKQIIEMAKKLSSYYELFRFTRFISLYKLTKDEQEYLINNSNDKEKVKSLMKDYQLKKLA